MRWYRDLYISSRLKSAESEIKKDLEDGVCKRDLYVITPAVNGKDLLDLRRGRDLKKQYLKEKDLLILGLAKGYDDAVELSVRILKERLKDGVLSLEGE